jgi:hypothetical protein
MRKNRGRPRRGYHSSRWCISDFTFSSRRTSWLSSAERLAAGVDPVVDEQNAVGGSDEISPNPQCQNPVAIVWRCRLSYPPIAVTGCRRVLSHFDEPGVKTDGDERPEDEPAGLDAHDDSGLVHAKQIGQRRADVT